MEWITVVRWVAGILFTGLGLILFGLNVWIFVKGVLYREDVPSPLPLINFFLLAGGCALLPLSKVVFLIGIFLGVLDQVLVMCASSRLPYKIHIYFLRLISRLNK
jgi:hypothetical protein